MLHLSAAIRDQLDCLTEVIMASVIVVPDSNAIEQFVQSLQTSASSPISVSNNNPLVQILASGNQNAVGQVISVLSQQFNQINTLALQAAADSEWLMEGSDV